MSAIKKFFGEKLSWRWNQVCKEGVVYKTVREGDS